MPNFEKIYFIEESDELYVCTAHGLQLSKLNSEFLKEMSQCDISSTIYGTSVYLSCDGENRDSLQIDTTLYQNQCRSSEVIFDGWVRNCDGGFNDTTFTYYSRSGSRDTVEFPREIIWDKTLDTSKTYIIDGYSVIEPGNTLTIPKGMKILGNHGKLVVKQGAYLIAEGTADEPIVFASQFAKSNRGRGVSISILGKAPIAYASDISLEYGDRAAYGGNVRGDSSGVFKYLRFEYSNEGEGGCFNALAVGSRTVMSHIQVKDCGRSSFNFNGGRVNPHHLISSGNGLSFYNGYQGLVSQLIIFQKKQKPGYWLHYALNVLGNDEGPRTKLSLTNSTIIFPEDAISNLADIDTSSVVKFSNLAMKTNRNGGIFYEAEYQTEEKFAGSESTISDSYYAGSIGFSEIPFDQYFTQDDELFQPNSYLINPSSPGGVQGVGAISDSDTWHLGWTKGL